MVGLGGTAISIACCAWLQGPGSDLREGPPPAPWSQAWSELALLAEAVPGSAQFDRMRRDLDGLQDRLDRSARKARDREASYRAQILRAQLARVAGAPFRPVGDPGPGVDLHQVEAWVALQVAAPGPLRVRAIRSALSESPGADLPLRVERALEAAEEDARNLRLDWAFEEAAALRELGRDRRGSRLLARVLRLRGDAERASEVLEEEIRAATDPADRAALENELGEVRLARGEEDRAVRHFASALAAGSSEAAVHLASRALSAGQSARARALYRSLLEGEFTRNGALRGYGLALLTPHGAGAGAARNPPGPSD